MKTFVALCVAILSLTMPATAAQLTLSWTDNSPNETGFNIERCPGAACSAFSFLATVGANVTTYVDTMVIEGAVYCYRVIAWNDAAVSAYSNTGCGTVAVVIPPSPTNLIISRLGTGAGTVVSSPAGVVCAGAQCTGTFQPGTVVTLRSLPAAGSRFVGWGGACTGADVPSAGYAPPTPTAQTFTDVAPSHPFVAWIEQLAAEGVTSGCGSGRYCPDAPVTRAQMAVFLLRMGHADRVSTVRPCQVAVSRTDPVFVTVEFQ